MCKDRLSPARKQLRKELEIEIAKAMLEDGTLTQVEFDRQVAAAFKRAE